MGSFITNLHVRGAEQQPVIEALTSLWLFPVYVGSTSGNAWTSIYPEAVDQNANELTETARYLSGLLHQPVIAFLVHDSEVFLYWLFDDGKQLDRYDSAPAQFAGRNLKPAGGNALILQRYCRSGTSTEQLRRLLHPTNSAAGKSAANAPGLPPEVKDNLLKKLRTIYPALAARQPNLPSLEQALAQAERHLGRLSSGGPGAPAAAGPHPLAEDIASELAGYLGIPEGRAVDSYRYLQRGEGTKGSLLHVDADGVRGVRIGEARGVGV
jgi:hypothetical protein